MIRPVSWPVLLAAGLVLATSARAGGVDALAQRPYRFDAGGIGTAVGTGAVLLGPDRHYTPSRGYGWVGPAPTAFRRGDLERSRTAFTIDGVAAEALAFQADVPAGRWWITLWIEAGREDSSTVRLRLNGAGRLPDWQAFLPPAEGRTEDQAIYRLFHGRVDAGAGGVRIEVDADAGPVRLLGLSLTPDPVPGRHPALQRRLAAAGRYEAAEPLDSLLADLERLRQHDPGDAFLAYWHEQVGLLSLAERYLQGMGWEATTRATGLGIFDRYHQAVMILDGLLDRPDRTAYPLYERALWQRGRLLYWLGRERHGPHEIAGGARDLAALYGLYPQDPLLAMYNGVQVDLPDPCDRLVNAPGAPAWSVLQREALCRVRALAHWWVDARQAPGGEFGGKLGDDVELLRWWPALILSGDTTARRGWQRLADGVWHSRHIHEGYAREVSDVEHASEFIADTAPMMVVYSEDPAYMERLRPTAHHFEHRWTGRTPAGHRLFRSAWFSATEVDVRPPRDRDVEMNTRAAKALRYLAWRTGDPHLAGLLRSWALAWAAAATRTDKGKPPGLLPASIRFPDEAINGDEPTWYRANMFWPYYDWAHAAGSKMLDQLFFTYTLTGDEALLAPLTAALDLVDEAGDPPSGSTPPEPGSRRWAAVHLRDEPGFWSVAAAWRLHGGDARFDPLLLRYGTPYVRYRLTDDEQHLADGLMPLLDAVRYNTPLRTAEVLHTDRVDVPGEAHLRAMLTGDGMPESMSPYLSVSWSGTDEAFTALVTDTGPERLALRVFSHAREGRTVRMHLWQLAPGRYRMILQPGQAPPAEEILTVSSRGQAVELTLPPAALLKVRFEKAD